MMFRRTLLLALLQVGSATAAGLGISSAQVPNRQAPPELHRAIQVLSGSWTISEEYPPSALYPNGGVGHGTEVWRAGPGNVTLVYEYHSTSPAGEMSLRAWPARFAGSDGGAIVASVEMPDLFTLAKVDELRRSNSEIAAVIGNLRKIMSDSLYEGLSP